MESPEYLKISLAAAMELGFVQGLFYRQARLHCINLLLTYESGCKGNCAFCGLSREEKTKFDDRKFIRVGWPTKLTDEIIERLIERQNRGIIERVCLSMVTSRRAVDDSLLLVKRLKTDTNLPISVLIAPTIMERKDIVALKEAGTERIGVAIDCATVDLFDKLRGKGVNGPHKWQRYWSIYEETLDVFGKNMAGVHLICGLGETERELTETIQRAKSLGGYTHLFSFFPEKTSALNEKTPPPMGQYRRIQMARWLIDNDISEFNRFSFDRYGRITNFGADESEIDKAIEQGDCFRTSGCPGKTMIAACNRPFANERPGPDIRNYPFPLEDEDKTLCRSQLFEDTQDIPACNGGY